MQDYCSLLYHEEEREMHPYCRGAGIGIIPWSPLARGLLARTCKASKETPTARQATDVFSDFLIGPTTEEDIIIIGRVEELAKKKERTMAQISIAWLLKKGVNPILGWSSIERVDEAAEGVSLARQGLLTDKNVKYLEESYRPKTSLSTTW
jgi:aryl-alcohol dehydrogenase-like predicted oxidoreductase